MAANLYDSAFATLGRIFGAAARSPITALTLAGGFASTVSWPATHFLLDALGWHGTYMVYAALLACVSAPLHALGPAARALPSRGHPGERRAAAACGPAALWLAVHSGGGGVCDLCLRSLWPVRAPVGDLRAFGHRRRHGGLDRRAVRAGAGRRAADRIRLRPQFASAVGGAFCAPCCSARLRCWRCWAYRCRWRRPSR